MAIRARISIIPLFRSPPPCRAQSRLDEAVKEAALARTLAEGWQRDVREAEKRTAAEAAKGAALNKELQVGQGGAWWERGVHGESAHFWGSNEVEGGMLV